ncbi:MAG: right-handed parallel beta-helix repeat-containing protein [Phycisphaerales bacterium]|nr:MAG: right-handed parallel beta-helix repeat-containing protein [Phycisphaerales bacterium]
MRRGMFLRAFLAAVLVSTAAGGARTYYFIADESTVVQTGGFVGGHWVWQAKGGFELNVDFAAKTASFGNVSATFGDGFSLGVVFEMGKLVCTDVNESAIHFELKREAPGFPRASIVLDVLFAEDGVRLVGGFCEPYCDGFCFDLDGRAVERSSIIYVDGDAAGANNGSSWADALLYLQDALMVALGDDEIRVAEGVYRPDDFVLSRRPNMGRRETFGLKSGVTIRGGYAGFGESDPDARDIELYETVLSGDLAGDDIEVEDVDLETLYWLMANTRWDDNCYTVVTGSGTDDSAVLDGFTITGGHANGERSGQCPDYDYRQGCGAGMYNEWGNPTVVNCTFRRNVAAGAYGAYGGGVFNLNSSLSLRGCRFIENLVYGANVSSAGGAMHSINSDVVVEGCVFRGNEATGYDSDYCGGAISNLKSRLEMSDCSFTDHCSPGGTLHSEQNSMVSLNRCLLAGNSGVIFFSGGRLRLANCTFAGNENTVYGDNWQTTTTLEAANCIFRDNLSNAPAGSWSQIEVSFSNVQGGFEGEGNIDVDPCFAQAGYWDDNGTPTYPWDDFWTGGDCHLKSQAGRWDPSLGMWVRDEATSPCIDAGDMTTPVGHEPFPNGGIVNMGAYGGTAEASKSYFGEPTCETIVAGDINGDCRVNATDFSLMAANWLRSGRIRRNMRPQVSIIRPEAGETIGIYEQGTPIEIEAEASDADGSVARVEFFVNGCEVCCGTLSAGQDDDGSDGWQTTWLWWHSSGHYPEGRYTLTAEAIDDEGLRAVSKSVEIYVHGPK